MQATNGQIHIKIVVIIEVIFPGFGNTRNNQLPNPTWSMLPKKLVVGIHVMPAATDDMTANMK